MNLLLLTRSIHLLHGYGGMERHCYDWIRAMTARGCRIHVVTMTPVHPGALSGYDPNVAFYLIPGVPARRVLARITSYPRWVERVRVFLGRLTESTPIDAVYAHGLAAAACEGLSIPAYYNPHGMEEFKTGGLKYLAYSPFRAMSRRAAAAARRVIATDRTLIPEIGRFLRVEEERIALIPNAVWFDTPAAPAPPAAVEGDPLFLAVGRMESNKGFHILIEALSRAKQLSPGWKLVLAGTGSREAQLKEQAQRRGLAERILFLGRLEESEMNALFARADLFVTSTLFEGSSIVTLEAMRAGLPVVASQTGGLPDKVIPGRNGWLVPPGDPGVLARSIEQACSVRASWKEMGAASREIVRDKYSWEVVGDQFLELFTKG